MFDDKRRALFHDHAFIMKDKPRAELGVCLGCSCSSSGAYNFLLGNSDIVARAVIVKISFLTFSWHAQTVLHAVLPPPHSSPSGATMDLEGHSQLPRSVLLHLLISLSISLPLLISLPLCHCCLLSLFFYLQILGVVEVIVWLVLIYLHSLFFPLATHLHSPALEIDLFGPPVVLPLILSVIILVPLRRSSQKSATSSCLNLFASSVSLWLHYLLGPR